MKPQIHATRQRYDTCCKANTIDQSGLDKKECITFVTATTHATKSAQSGNQGMAQKDDQVSSRTECRVMFRTYHSAFGIRTCSSSCCSFRYASLVPSTQFCARTRPSLMLSCWRSVFISRNIYSILPCVVDLRLAQPHHPFLVKCLVETGLQGHIGPIDDWCCNVRKRVFRLASTGHHL